MSAPGRPTFLPVTGTPPSLASATYIARPGEEALTMLKLPYPVATAKAHLNSQVGADDAVFLTRLLDGVQPDLDGAAVPGWYGYYCREYANDVNVANTYAFPCDQAAWEYAPAALCARAVWTTLLLRDLISVAPRLRPCGMGGIVNRTEAVNRRRKNPYAYYPTPHLASLGIDFFTGAGHPGDQMADLTLWILSVDPRLRDPRLIALMDCTPRSDWAGPVHYVMHYLDKDSGLPRSHWHVNLHGAGYVHPPADNPAGWVRLALTEGGSYPALRDGIDPTITSRTWACISPRYFNRSDREVGGTYHIRG